MKRDEVGHDQSDEWNCAHRNDRGRHRNRYQHQPQRDSGRIIQPQACGHTLAHAGHREAVRVQVRQDDDRQDEIDDLVVALHDF
ncbi:hypothetical protein D3C71_2056480 [compost metagenome]